MMVWMADAQRPQFQPSGPIAPGRTKGVLFLPARIEAIVGRLVELVKAKRNPVVHGFNQVVRDPCRVSGIVLAV